MKTAKTKKEEAKETSCPTCGSTLRTYWVEDRMLRSECSGDECYSSESDSYGTCGWAGQPYVPPKKRISMTCDAFTVSACWHYESFDQYGYTFVVSEGFSSKAACTKAAKKEIAKINSLKTNMGKCVAIVWPPSTKVRGMLVK